MPLADRYARFVEEYLVDLNATEAYVRSGGKARGKAANVMGCRWIAREDVQEAIKAGMAERSKRTEITADYVLEVIRDTLERCRQAQPVVDRKGQPVYVQTPNGETAPAYSFDAQAVLKGAELLGKNLKLFTDKVDHTSSDGSMTPTAIERRIVDHARD